MNRRLRTTVCSLLLAALLPSAAIASEVSAPPNDLSFATETTLSMLGEPKWAGMLDTAQQVLQAAHAQYEGASGTVRGFYPGSPYYYPNQPIPFYFYSRDTATILPAAQYFYDEATLRTPIEEFLWLQYGPSTRSVDGDLGMVPGQGAISATISPALTVNKATVVSDEETSLIHAAYRYYRAAGGSPWLEKKLNGRAVLNRLNAAMDWLLEHRRDAHLGLIVRAHTTDWGDVKPEPADNPTDIGPSDAWSYSIYDQALAFGALMELSEMNRAAGRAASADYYYGVAQELRRRASERLWMPERGYFRIHGHVSSETRHAFDEDAIVSIGNAAALYYGLATLEQGARIMDALERARLEAGAPKPGLTLQPAYPMGAFANAAMSERAYQNGAVWDWWGGRQIMGEFLYGNARLAKEHLALVADDWARHPGKVYEWESPWQSRASDDYRYAGAAAVMAEALIEGLYGVSIAHNGVELQPRLGTQDGSIRVYQAANNVHAAYRYTYRSESGEIELRLNTNSPAMVPIRVLLPGPEAGGWGLGQVEGWRWDVGSSPFILHPSPWLATLDGAPVPFTLERIGRDTYLALESLPGEHRLVLRPAGGGRSSD